MEYNVADVIINNPSSELDRPFTYLIPERFLGTIEIGSRVIIPFGNGNNNIEGFVINTEKRSVDIKLKEISEIIDEKKYFCNNMLILAKWMSKKYMCTLLDSLKCILPTGITTKSEKMIVLLDANLEKIKGAIQNKIIEILIDNNNIISYSKLLSVLKSKSANSSITSLTNKGIIKIEYKTFSGIKNKTIKVAMLNISQSDAQLFIENISKENTAKERVVNILIDNEYVEVPELIKFADASYATLNTLIKNKIITYKDIHIDRDPYYNVSYTPTVSLPLSDDQNKVLSEIINSLKNRQRDSYLLHGVTGSGKTEVYLQAIDFVIKNNGHAIVLVPEISLTPQMVKRFKSRFGEKVAVIHSRLSLGERFDQWEKIRDGKVNVVIGARSAIFAPFDNLELIIVDEEHESSYKSENTPKFHVKDIALKRQEIENCVIVLGSATPNIDTYYESKLGIYKLLEMKNRINSCVLPEVEIIDMRKELEEGNRSIFSNKLYEQISKNIEKGEQTILFLNRRGHSTFVSCRSCGLVLKCPNCNITLTYHKNDETVMCHYCGFHRKNPTSCPVCKSKYIKYFGIGTQKVEEEISRLFPNASVLRMDFDTTSTKASHEKILDKFEKENVNILIGTQMIAKGLDFSNVTLVGVISADLSLNIEDYHAAERTFQLLTQVAGRAGRGEKLGQVIIQTYNPDNYSIQLSKNHDYVTFYENEIVSRKNLAYPPFVDLISIIISHLDQELIKNISYKIGKRIKTEFDNNKIKYIIYKPTLAPISKIKQRYRWRLLIKIEKGSDVQEILKKIYSDFYEQVSISIDVNSNNML